MTTELLNQLLDHALDLNIVLNDEYEIIFVNQAATVLLGYNKSALLKTDFFDLIHPDDETSIRKTLDAIAQAPGVNQHTTFRVKHKTKGWRIFEAHSWSNSSENKLRVLFCGHDATNRVVAQQELREKESQLRRAQRVAGIGNWELNLNTSEISASDQYFKLFGLAPRETITLSEIREFTHPEDRDRVREIIRDAQETMGSFDFRYRIVRTDGTVRIFNTKGRTEYYGNEFIMYGYVHDITEQVNREEAVILSKQRLSALAAQQHKIQEEERARLAREVHDVLGQATTALRLDIHWLLQNAPKDDKKYQQRAQQALTQIEETITMVRRIAHELRPGILDHLGIGAAIDWMSEQFSERSSLTFDITNEVEDDLELDPDLATAFFRIFQEAVTNVIKHADAQNVRVLLSRNETDLLLEIEDDGKGICESDLYGSSSLGILNMQERVLPWNGSFSINGKPGAGTLIKVAVPNA